MKKIHSILLAALLFIGLAACGAPTATTTPSVPSVVKFADPVLEVMVRGAMGKPEGDITQAEAQAVTRMDFSNVWSQYLPDQAELIHDLGGLESFTNLESLDLSFHAITDVSPLAGLTKLTALSLAGNPVTDVAPLAKLTNLKLLILSKCQAQDYSALSNLTNLQVLLLDNSTISDVSPLASLTNLQTLYLDKSSVEDFSSIENIYTTLANKDFIIPYTLKDLGFNLDLNMHEATYESEGASFTINHEVWGPPSREDNLNIIRMSLYMNDVYKVSIGYYSVHKVYVVQIDKEGEQQANYLYNLADGSADLSPEDLTNAQQMVRGAMDLQEGEDVLAAPVHFYNDTIKNTFHMTPEKLFTLLYEPPTLKSLGFYPDEVNAVWRYDRDVNIEIHRPEWGEKDYDFLFFASLSDEYRIVVTYNIAERKYVVKADDNDGGSAAFEVFIETYEHVDTWCSNEKMTVEEYFINAYNDPEIEDIYLHSAELMEQYIRDTFGMTIEELYALPTGE